MNSMLLLCIVACIGTLTVAFPQQRPNGFPGGNNQNPFLPRTTTPATNMVSVTTTTQTPLATPEFFACMQACPTTSQYNPVCGSDNQNYHNSARLDCAARCGRNVVAVRLGTCQGL